MFKNFLKYILPNFLVKIVNKILKRDIKITGKYFNWDEALNNSFGYDDNRIFDKSKKSFIKVLNNKADYERDSVLFYKENINYSLIKILHEINFKLKRVVNILDFGGSFASIYFQNGKILKNNKNFIWSVVEREQIVNYANSSKIYKKINSSYSNLNFYSTIEDYLRFYFPDLVLFSGVLHYLPKPFDIIKFLINIKVKYFLILRTPFHQTADEIKIQIVPKHIYKSSYPIRVFNEKSFLKHFLKNNYRTVPVDFKNEMLGNFNFKNFFLKYD
jgi:putative methyltransferase (TIGR04325 family)